MTDSSHSPRSTASTLLPLIRRACVLSCLSAPLAAFQAPDYSFTSEWTQTEVVDPGEGAVAPFEFRAAEVGEFNYDGLIDVLVIAEDRARLLVDPGLWSLSLDLTPVSRTTVVAEWVRNANTLSDAVLTAESDNGLHWYGFAPAPTPNGHGGVDVHELVSGSTAAWSQIDQLRTDAALSGSVAIEMVAVLDSALGFVHYGIVPTNLPYGGTPVLIPGAPISVGTAVTDIEWVDWTGNGFPELVTVSGSALTVYSLFGTPIATQTLSGGIVELSRFGDTRTSTGGLVVWHVDASTSDLHGTSYYHGAQVSSFLAPTNDVLPRVVEYDGDEYDDLVLFDPTSLTTWILAGGCDLGTGSTYHGSFSTTACSETDSLLAPIGASTIGSCPPVWADLDADSFVDFLVFDETSGLAHTHFRNPPVGQSPPVQLSLGSAIEGAPTANGTTWEFTIDVDEALDPQAEYVEFLLWRIDEDATGYEMGDFLRYSFGAVVEDQGEYSATISFPFDFDPDEVYGFEFRASSFPPGAPRVLHATWPLVYTESCTLWDDITTNHFPTGASIVRALDCSGQIDGWGELPGGILEMPSFELFTKDDLPPIPPTPPGP